MKKKRDYNYVSCCCFLFFYIYIFSFFELNDAFQGLVIFVCLKFAGG